MRLHRAAVQMLLHPPDTRRGQAARALWAAEVALHASPDAAGRWALACGVPRAMLDLAMAKAAARERTTQHVEVGCPVQGLAEILGM